MLVQRLLKQIQGTQTNDNDILLAFFLVTVASFVIGIWGFSFVSSFMVDPFFDVDVRCQNDVAPKCLFCFVGKNPDQVASGSVSSGSEGPIELIECEWCPETFTRLSRAIEHKYRKHNYESKNYFCTLCGKLFPLKVALDQHQNSTHKHDKEMNVPRLDFICGFCGTAFISESALELHVKTAHNLEKRMMAHPFIPSLSKKVRLNQAGEIISIYYCHLCGSEYMLKFNLLKHIEDRHSYEERCAMPEDMLKCSTCDSMFYTKKAFDAHNVHHKPEDLYVTSEEQRLNIVARVDQDFDFRRVPTALDKALGSLGSSSTDSATALAKKHVGKAKRAKNTASTTSGGEVNGIDVLKLLLEEAGKPASFQPTYSILRTKRDARLMKNKDRINAVEAVVNHCKLLCDYDADFGTIKATDDDTAGQVHPSGSQLFGCS